MGKLWSQQFNLKSILLFFSIFIVSLIFFVSPENVNASVNINDELWLSSPVVIHVYNPHDSSFSLNFYKKHNKLSSPILPHEIKTYDKNDSLIDSQEIYTTGRWTELTIPATSKGVYKIEVLGASEDWFRLSVYLDQAILDTSGDLSDFHSWPRFHSETGNYVYGNYYIFVPENATSIYAGINCLETGENARLELIKPDGGSSFIELQCEDSGPSWTSYNSQHLEGKTNTFWRVRIGATESVFFTASFTSPDIWPYVNTEPSAWFNPDEILIPPSPPPGREKLKNIRAIPGGFLFINDLQKGMGCNEQYLAVRYLQIMLAEEGPEVYPESLITGCFGTLTKEAVIRFQEKYFEEILAPSGLARGTGFVGENTKEKLNELLESYREILNTEDRVFVIDQSVSDNYKGFNIDNLPREVILAVASQETGARYNFNNELIGGDGIGRGIMQITTRDFVGAGSGVTNEDVNKCKNLDKQACYRYYANTIEGVEANIKDGLYALEEKYSFTKTHYDLCKQGIDEWSKCEQYGISCEEMRWISAVQRYRTYTEYAQEVPPDLIGKIENPQMYLKNIASKLRDLSNWFFNIDSNLTFGLADKFESVWDRSKWIKIFSPGELQIYDSQKRVTGLIDGEVKEGIPNSIYDKEEEVVVLFFPDDDYFYQVKGTDQDNYGIIINSIGKAEELITFSASEIPILPGEVHQYSVDWKTLSQGGDCVKLQVDEDGDGDFKKTITTDKELTVDEFILQTETTINCDPDALNLKSNGKWLTCYIELPEKYNVKRIDGRTVLLEILDNTVEAYLGKQNWADAKANEANIIDNDNDGILERMVKFDRKLIQDCLSSSTKESLEVLVSGRYARRILFAGTAGLKIINN